MVNGSDCEQQRVIEKEYTDDRGKKRLQIASVVCLLFVIAELAAGILANSIAVQADAAHMLTDLMSFGVSLIALRIADIKPTKTYTYGFIRAEIIGALMSIVTLWIITAVLVYSAILRIFTPEDDIDPDIMIGISIAAVVFNIILGCILMGSGHTHSHGGGSHSHSHGVDAVNIRAAIVHVLGDLVQSLGVLVAGLIIKFLNVERAYLADPICTLVFLAIILFTTLRIVKDLFKILMCHVDEQEYDLLNHVLNTHGYDVHMLHIWTIVPGQVVVTAHLSLNKGLTTSREVLILVEEDIRKVLPHLKCLTLQTSCSCVPETYCHSIKG